MSEAHIPHYDGEPIGRLTLVSKNTDPAISTEHETVSGPVLFRLNDDSLSTDEIATHMEHALTESFTLQEFRKMDREEQPRYILRSLLTELQITADETTLQEYADLGLENLTEGEKEAYAHSVYVGRGILKDAIDFWQELDSDAARDFREELEDFIDDHGYYGTNLLRALQLARKKVSGHDDAILLAQRYAKTMLYMTTDAESKPV